jgi:demethylmenaquinone methyltransferase/2-methoxy-6-polyprenyl-1,4-benzoquinol methylase
MVVDRQMREYYERRAAEYDDWWLDTGLFADRDRPGWAQEVEELTAVVAGLPAVRTLDVACGTGFLTRHLRGEVTALDQSRAMVEIASDRMPHARVVRGDAVPLPFADGEFDAVFTAHFYGHLLDDERAAFLREARRVAPRLIVVDSARREDTEAEQWQERKLNDGSHHRVYKRWFTPAQLREEIGGEVLYDGRWFVAVG